MKNLRDGLSYAEVKRLQELHGFNEISMGNKKHVLETIANIITEPMFAMLLVAAFIYILIGNVEDALFLSIFIFISIGITFFQQRKSEKAVQALRDLSSPQSSVIREGIRSTISSRELVIGDLIYLKEGDRVPADASLLVNSNLLVDESLLTGESEPVEKIGQEPIYSGSLIVRGGAIAQVQKIGLHTEIGKIGVSLREIIDPQSPLHKNIQQLIKRFAILGLSLALIVLLLYVYIYADWLEGILVGISLTMALMPEELTVILTVFMALGIWRISKKHVLTKKTTVIETLGCITTLCVDKTGTLTLNKMSLEAIATDHGINELSDSLNLNKLDKEVLLYALLASHKEPFEPMEMAFKERQELLDDKSLIILNSHTLAHEYGLNSNRPAMTQIWKSEINRQECVIAIKGAPEYVMKLCQLQPQQIKAIENQLHEMATKGLRILGIAKGSLIDSKEPWPQSIESIKFQWLGLTGLKDPLRKEVPEAIQTCNAAGIRTIMITGDHAMTAEAIAKQAGISSCNVISGAEIESLSDTQLQAVVRKTSIFVRIKPNQKLRIVKALQNNNEIVAMTGDGVNDAQALKAANVGISMGRRGTDVAREASSLVLMNDDFASIVETIKQGRQIYDNLQKAIMYVIAIHIPIAGCVFIPLALGFSPMLTPIHILFLEMVIDPSCAVVFEAEEPEANLMTRPPRNISLGIIKFDELSLAFAQGLGLLLIVISLYIGLQNYDYSVSTSITISFGSLVLGNLILVLVNRSKNVHIFNLLKTPNPSLYWIASITILVYWLSTTHLLQERFNFSALTLDGYLLILGSAVLGLTWYETAKFLYRYTDASHGLSKT